MALQKRLGGAEFGENVFFGHAIAPSGLERLGDRAEPPRHQAPEKAARGRLRSGARLPISAAIRRTGSNPTAPPGGSQGSQ